LGATAAATVVDTAEETVTVDTAPGTEVTVIADTAAARVTVTGMRRGRGTDSAGAGMTAATAAASLVRVPCLSLSLFFLFLELEHRGLLCFSPLFFLLFFCENKRCGRTASSFAAEAPERSFERGLSLLGARLGRIPCFCTRLGQQAQGGSFRRRQARRQQRSYLSSLFVFERFCVCEKKKV
jgi:hypothetical protein